MDTPSADAMFAQEFNTPIADAPEKKAPTVENTESFSKSMFGVDDPSSVLEPLGESTLHPGQTRYKFAGDGKVYSVPKDLSPQDTLEKIWDYNSPGLWGSAKASSLYGIPADMASAVSYGLGGLGFDEDSKDWRTYSDKVKSEYEKRYGQFMVPTASAALEQGKLLDYALQTLGSGAPYMGLALTGGALGGAAVGAAGLATVGAAGTPTAAAALGSFLGSTAITSPVFVAQFADRQVAQLKANGVENPEEHIDWPKALGFGVAASGLNSLPVEAIFYGGPILNTLKRWGVDLGSKTSARMLGSVADVAGSNALASSGTQLLSRLNADMPLLDDGAKAEYLDAAIAGSLVGIPFGLYSGFKPHPHLVSEPPSSIEGSIAADRDDTPGPRSPGGLGVKPIYAKDESKIAETPRLGPPRSAVIHDVDDSYGINDINDALGYLNDINYSTPEGKTRNALNDFVRKYGTKYSDADAIDTARRVKRVRDLKVQTTDNGGMLWKTLDDLPQVHSNKPEIISKAAYLTDNLGYDDGTVKGMSDSLITKLFSNNIKKDLGKLKNTPEAMLKVYRDAMNTVDPSVEEAVKQYGSLYRRPQALERHGMSVAERRDRISKDPRKILSEMLTKTRKEQAGDKAYSSFLGSEGEFPLRHPDISSPKFAEEPPTAGDAFNDYAGLRKPPMGPRALLEYHPFDDVPPVAVADTLHKGNSRPDDKISDKLSKKEFVDFFMNTPMGKALGDRNAVFRAIKKSNEVPKPPKETPYVDSLGNQFRPQDTPEFKAKREAMNQNAKEHLKMIRDELEKIQGDKNSEILRVHPDLKPALNDLFKRIAENTGHTDIGKGPDGSPRGYTKASQANKSAGFYDNALRREKILSTIEHAFTKINPRAGKTFRSYLEKALAGEELGVQDLANLATAVHTAFHLDHVDKNVDPKALENLYKALRAYLPHKVIRELDNDTRVLGEWYKTTSGLAPGDLKGFSPSDVESAAFYSYLSGAFKPNYKEFKGSTHKQTFELFEKILKSMRKELGDQGIKHPGDLFEYNPQSNENVPPNAQGPEFVSRVHHDTNSGSDKAQADLNAQGESVKDAAADHLTDRPIETNIREKNESSFLGGWANNSFGTLANGTNVLYSMVRQARKYPAIAKILGVMQNMTMTSAEHQGYLGNKYNQLKDKYGNKRIFEACNYIAHLRKTDQKMEFDTSGRLVFNKDGQKITLNSETSQLIRDTADFMKEPLRRAVGAFRKELNGFSEEGLTERSSLADINKVIEDFDGSIRGNPIATIRAQRVARKEALESLRNKIHDFTDILSSNEAYVPFMRFGDYVVQVVDKMNKNQTVHLASINDQNIFGLKTRLPSEKQARDAITKMGLYKKFGDGSRYDIRHFQMTYGNIASFLNKNMVSTEMLQGMLASGINDQMNLADQLGTGVKNHKEFFKAFAQDTAGLQDQMTRYMAAKGFGRFHVKSENIDGHSEDWGRVIDNMVNLYSNSLGRFSTARDWTKVQASIHSEQGIPDAMRKMAQNYLDYLNNPTSDYSGLRAFNFVWAMGFRPSSAILQLLTLPQQSLGLSLEYSPNLLRNATLLSWTLKNAIARNTGLSHSFSDEFSKILNNDRIKTILRSSIKEDAIKNLGYGSTGLGRVSQGINVGVDAAGFLIKNIEHLTREASFGLYWHMFQNRNILKDALKQREKDNYWNEFWDQNKNHMDVETALSLYSTQETHSLFGKLGRGPLQRGLMGSAILPFMTYAQQTMEVMGSQLAGHRGPKGVMAGLWTAGSYMALAGLSGIPAYELWKTLYETYQKKVNNKTTDLDMELKDSGVPMWARKGLLSSATGTDLSSRIGQSLIGQQLLVGALKGEFKLNEVGGVPGRTFQGLMDAASELSNPLSTRGPMQVIAPVLPAVVQDVIKAIDPEASNRTTTGKAIEDPSGISNGERIAQGLGFTPLNKTEERERLYFAQRANQEFNLFKQRLSESLSEGQYQKSLGHDRGDSELITRGQALIDQANKELTRFAKDNKMVIDNKMWQGIISGAKERLWQKQNPGKIRKPTQDQLRHMDALTKDEVLP